MDVSHAPAAGAGADGGGEIAEVGDQERPAHARGQGHRLELRGELALGQRQHAVWRQVRGVRGRAHVAVLGQPGVPPREHQELGQDLLEADHVGLLRVDGGAHV